MKFKVTQIILDSVVLPQPFCRDNAHRCINLLDPPPMLVGWTAHRRGGVLVLVSPPHWTLKSAMTHLGKDKDGPRVAFEFPASAFRIGMEVMGWDGVTLDNSLAKFDTPPWGRPIEEPAESAPAYPLADNALAEQSKAVSK